MHVLLICNPNSTSQDAALYRRILPPLRAVDGLTMEARFTQRPGHAKDMVRGLTREDFDAIIAVGGDGTVNEIINGMLGPAPRDAGERVDAAATAPTAAAALPTLGVIPAGSANVFVRALGFSARPEKAAHELAAVLQRAATRRIYLGAWDGQWFAVNAGFGLDANVLAKMEKVRERGFAATPWRYLAVAGRAWAKARWRPPQIDVCATARSGETLRLDGVPVLLASNTNPWTFFGSLPMVTNPRNSFCQGLGLFAMTRINGFTGIVGMLHLIGADSSGWLRRFVRAATVEFDDAAQVELVCPRPHRFQADGEYEGKRTRVTLTSVPDAIEVFAPSDDC